MSELSDRTEPVWDPRSPLASGSDKEVFMGTFKGKAVAVCVARQEQGGEERLMREVEALELIGRHEHIVEMVHHCIGPSQCYVALEVVEPVGFDLDRLVKQYLFAKQSVPSQLTRRLIGQLCSALDHMHESNVIHRDVKVENVLVTANYDAKLIDMGIACEIGSQEKRWVYASKTYFAPEMCQGGRREQGTEVDTWGLGVVLHQMYQHRWDLLNASKVNVVFRPNRPCKQEPMEENLMEAMVGLLAMDPSKRWSTKKCQEKIPAEVSGGSAGWHAPTAEKTETRKYLCQYKDSRAPLTAYAAIVDNKSKHLHGKTVEELAFRQAHNAILLLVDVPACKAEGGQRLLEKTPKKDTVIPHGAWLYFGMPPSDNTEEAIAGLKEAIFPEMKVEAPSHMGRSVNAKAGLMAFSLEFDCFKFPPHIGTRAVIGRDAGNPEVTQLNLRSTFGLNLAGILRAKSKEPEWFPGPTAKVEPGDLGLVVRCPCQDGSTEPTMTDEEIRPLMSRLEFEQKLPPQVESLHPELRASATVGHLCPSSSETARPCSRSTI